MNMESSISKDVESVEHKVVASKSLVKKLFSIGLTLFAVWVLVFTMVWTYVTDLGIHWMYELATITDSDPPDFRVYIKHRKVLNDLCNASNWVANKTRPIVSDEVLVALWEAKHVRWEDIARNAKPGYTDFEKTDPDYSSSVGLASIWMVDPRYIPDQMRNDPHYYDVPVEMNLLMNIGRQRSGRACKGKGGFVVKRIYYYHFTPPVIYEGRVMRQSDLDYYEEVRGKPPWSNIPGIKLVGNTDWDANEFKVARMLNERWFIVHHTLKD